MDGTFGGLEMSDLHLASGVGDTVTYLESGGPGFGYTSTNLTADYYIYFGTTGGNLWNYTYQAFQVATW